jgi:hypothetical protein
VLFVFQFFNSAVVLPKYSKTRRLRSCTSPAAHGKHKPRNAVDDQAQALFARPEGILSPLRVVNVSHQHVPTGDTAFRDIRQNPTDLKSLFPKLPLR